MDFIKEVDRRGSHGGVACAQIDGSGKIRNLLSQRELDAYVEKIAHFLRGETSVDDSALLIYPAGVDFLAAFLACLKAGVTAVPVPALDAVRLKRSLPRLRAIIADSRARLILTSDCQKGLVEQAFDVGVDQSDAMLSVVSTTFEAVPAASESTAGDSLSPPRAAKIAYLQYTSGSTGDPKGVEITHDCLVHHCRALTNAWGYSESSVSVTWMPHFHDYGLIDGLLMPFFNRTPCYILSPVGFIKRPYRWLQALSQLGGTHTQAPNFAYAYCSAKIKPGQVAGLDLSKVEVFSNGAEPVREKTLSQFFDTFKECGLRRTALFPAYGLAEATLVVSTKVRLQDPRTISVDKASFDLDGRINVIKSGKGKDIVSCGKPLSGTEVKIVDPEALVELNAREIGEIWVRSVANAIGYWNRPDETQEIFQARISGVANSEKYLRTGDLGFIYEGELYPTGRIKDLLILNGANIFPQDIEELISTSIHEIRDGATAAFADSREDTDELVFMAEIKRREHANAETAAKIYSLISQELQFPPAAIVLIKKGSIQKTSSGKIQRNRCRQMWLDGTMSVLFEWSKESADREASSGEGSVLDKENLEPWIKEKVAELTGKPVRSVGSDTHFNDLGLDSKGATGLIGELEEALGEGCELPISLLWSNSTPRKLSQGVWDLLEGAPRHQESDSIATESLENEIAIVGLSCRFPGADSPEDFWQLMQSGADAISATPGERQVLQAQLGVATSARRSPIDRAGFIDRVEYFDAEFFGITAREARIMDPQQRLILETVRNAFECAAIPPETWQGRRVGVFLGVATNDYGRMLLGQPEVAEAYTGPGQASSIVANRVSYLFDFRGPSMTIDTACSSSLVAFHQAVLALQNGECDMAVTGGVNLVLDPAMGLALQAGGMLSETGVPRVFDEDADGYVRGEGVGIVILKRLAEAESAGDTIRACVVGSSVNQDGRSNGLTAPNPSAQVSVMREAVKKAGINANEVSYIEAHGTGTPLGDPIEIGAIDVVYGGGGPCFVGSVKSSIGHLEGAAGIAGLIKSILVVENRTAPPQANLRRLSTRVNQAGTRVKIASHQVALSDTSPVFAAVSSFGFGGTNAHAILKSAPERDGHDVAGPYVSPSLGPLVLPLSAHNESALTSVLRAYQDQLAREETNAQQLCHTAALGRSQFRCRAAATGDNRKTLLHDLDCILQARKGNPGPNQKKGVSWLFSGQGAQYPGMALPLMRHSVFARAFEDCADMVRATSGIDLIAGITGSDDALRQTALAQPAIFAIEFSLAQLYLDWGMEPVAVAGHSLGELTAACIAGAIELEVVLPYICQRADLMGQLEPGGAMLAVRASYGSALSLTRQYPGLEIAAVNGAASVVLSGSETDIESAVGAFREANVRTRRLNVSHAFHSAAIDPILSELRTAAQSFRPGELRFPLYSNLTGSLISAEELTADYWVKHARNPVLFGKCIEAMAPSSSGFLEIGPGSTLSTLTESALEDSDPEKVLPCVPGLPQHGSVEYAIGRGLALHFEQGSPISWDGVFGETSHQRCVLPGYGFTRQPFLFTPNRLGGIQATSAAFQFQHRTFVPSSNIQIFSSQFSETLTPLLREHKVFERVVVPGAGLLALVGRLPGLSDHGGCFLHLEDVTFLQPLIFQHDEIRDVQLTLPLEEGSHQSDLELSSFEAGNPANTFVVHLRGTRIARPQKLKLATGSIEDLRKQCNLREQAEFYTEIWQPAIHLGDRFRWVNSLFYGDNELLVKLERPRRNEAALTALPGLLDSIFQGIVAGVTLDPEDALVPFAIDKILLDIDDVEDAYWVRIRIEDIQNREAGIRADFQIFDENGRVLGQILGFRAKRVNSDKLLGARVSSSGKGFYSQEWIQLDVGQAQSDPFNKFVVVSDDEKLGVSLVHRLRLDGAPTDSAVYYASMREFCETGYERNRDGVPIELENFLPEGGRVALIVLIDPTPGEGSPSVITDRTLDFLCELDRLFSCTQASPSIDITLVTTGALWFEGELPTGVTASFGAAIGYARSARKESISGSWRIVDTDPDWTRDQTTDELSRLFLTDVMTQGEIICREDRRYRREISKLEISQKDLRPFSDETSCLITGGLGGLGLVAAKQLADRGAKTIWLIGRSKPGADARAVISSLEEAGVGIFVRQVNIEEPAAVASLIEEIRRNGVPLRGIYHCAGVLEDRTAGRYSRSNFDGAVRPKLLGALLLDQMTADEPITEFVLFSSISAVFGNMGQAAYGAANESMATVAASRVRRGLPALVLEWGPWRDIGMAARQGPDLLSRLATQGFHALTSAEGSELLGQGLMGERVKVIAAILGDGESVKDSPEGRLVASDIGRPEKQNETPFLRDLVGLSFAETIQKLSDYLYSEINAALKGSGKGEVGEFTPLFDIGLDSLGAVELRNRVASALGLKLRSTVLFDYPNINALSNYLAERFTISGDVRTVSDDRRQDSGAGGPGWSSELPPDTSNEKSQSSAVDGDIEDLLRRELSSFD